MTTRFFDKRAFRAAALLLSLALLFALLPGRGYAEEVDDELAVEATAEPTAEPGVELTAEPTAEPTTDDEGISLIEQEEWWLEEDWDDLRPFYRATYTWLRLDRNVTELDKVGHQYGGQACACYSLAYCRTLLDGYWHDIQEFNLGLGEADAYCSWYAGDYTSNFSESISDIYEGMYLELCQGRPVALLVKNHETGQHYVAVVGFENVENGKPLDADNFLILDPCTESFEPENMGARGFVPRRVEDGNYQLLVDTSGKSTRFEAHKSSYLSSCSITPISRLAVTLEKTELRSLPCAGKLDADSRALCLLKAGQPFTITALVRNQSGDYWYRGVTLHGITGYVPAESVSPGTILDDGPAVEDIEVPDLLTEGESFTVAGKLIAGRHPFRSIVAEVYAGTEAVGEPVLSARIDASRSLCRLDKNPFPEALHFETLTPGAYCLVITVDCPSCFSADGRIMVTEENCIVLLSLVFAVCERIEPET